MAVTLIKSIKEDKNRAKHHHLKASIRYIMNPKKTENNLWVGSNCGTDSESIIRAFIDTKKDYGKEWGRQGYHFVISFAPGECDERTAYNIGKEFLESYLQDDYDYCFAVHNDHDHMHVHMIFNSVNRMTGYKYRYVNGDWEKYIQPITDKLCVKYNLPELVYDKTKKRVGKSYGLRMAENNNKFTWSKIIKADIDFAISVSEDFLDYKNNLIKMGYRLREGNSRKHGKYIAYFHPGLNEKESKKAHRDYNLGKDYTITSIESRIALKDKTKLSYIIKDRSELPYINYPKSNKTRYQLLALNRVTQAYEYQFLDLRIKDAIRARKDLLRIDKIRQECDYILDNDIKSINDVRERLSEVKREINSMFREQDLLSAEGLSFSPEELEDRARYIELQNMLSRQELLSDEAFESVSDEAFNLEVKYMNNSIVLDGKPRTDSRRMEDLKEEKRILNRLLRDQEIYESVSFSVPEEQVMRKELGRSI